MSFFSYIILTILGIILCVFGADLLVKGASGIAAKLRIPPLIIGLTIVAFGTSLPELVVGVSASLKSNSEVILGNVLGSNAFNTLLILGIAALIHPLSVRRLIIRREVPFSILIIVIFFILANDALFGWSVENKLNRIDAAVFLLLFSLFLGLIFLSLKKDTQINDKAKTLKKGAFRLSILTVAGLGLLVLGGELAVRYAIISAHFLNISESLIAATLIAGGTSLPELVTSTYAALKKEPDIAVGNVIGSNIFNLLLIPGVSGIIGSISYDSKYNFDLGFFLLGTIILVIAMFTGTRRKLDRWEAFILILLYGGYSFHIFNRTGLT
ncbi:calcium/sodium antiporter [Fibrobacterota bacterium]